MTKEIFNPVEIAKELINIPTITPDNGEGILYLKQKLEHLGFECCVKEFHSPGSEYKTPNLYAKLGASIGETSLNLCFAGHTDVVPPGSYESWTYPPFKATEKGGVLYGRGASDMKGAIAAFVSACSGVDVEELKNSGKSISLLITGDEEGHAIDGTKRMLDYLVDKYNEQITLAIVGEASCSNQLGDAIKVGRRGSMTIHIEVTGKQGHTAYPEKAINPIEFMISVLNEIKSIKLDDGDKYFAPSRLVITSVDVGNKASNVVPEKIKATINIRFNTNHNFKSLKDLIKDTFLKYVHGENLKITTTEGAEPFMGISEDNPYLSQFMNIVKDETGIFPELNTKGGTSDARFLYKVAPVFEFGVPNESIHKIDENVKIKDLNILRNIYSKLINLFLI